MSKKTIAAATLGLVTVGGVAGYAMTANAETPTPSPTPSASASAETGRSDQGTSDRAQSDQGKPDHGQSDHGKSDEAQSDQGSSDQGSSDQGSSDQAKSDQAKSDQAKSDQGKPDRDRFERGGKSGQHGDRPGKGAPHEHATVTGDELTKVTDAVQAKETGVEISEVQKDPDGSYDVTGTKDGDRIAYDVSSDLGTVTERAGR